jgi:hypothetical protein
MQSPPVGVVVSIDRSVLGSRGPSTIEKYKEKVGA